MQISNYRMKELIQQSLLEALQGQVDSFDSPLSSYQSPLTNKISRVLLVTAENLASTMQKVATGWKKISTGPLDSRRITQFRTALDKIWDIRLAPLLNTLRQTNSLDADEQMIMKKQFPELEKIKVELQNILEDIEKSLLAINELPQFIDRREIQKAKQSGQQVNPQEIERMINVAAKGIIDSLFGNISSVFSVLKMSRGLFQKVGNAQVKVGKPVQSSHFNQQTGKMEQSGVFNVLQELDDVVIKYYSAIEAMFHAFLGIGNDLQRGQVDIGQEMFDMPEPSRSDDMSTDPHYRRRKKDDLYRHKKALRDLFPGEDRFVEKIPEHTFDRDAFIAFISDRMPVVNATDGNPSSAAKTHPAEAKKAQIIKQLQKQIDAHEDHISVMFGDANSPPPDPNMLRTTAAKRKLGLRNNPNLGIYGRFNKHMFNTSTGQYKMPEVKPMFLNMLRVKKLYKSEFNKILSDLENYPTSDPKSMKQFFADEKKEVENALQFFAYAKIEFKGLINSILTGNSSTQSSNDIDSIANQTTANKQQKVADRQRYYDIFKSLGWLPQNTSDQPPSWLYSQ